MHRAFSRHSAMKKTVKKMHKDPKVSNYLELMYNACLTIMINKLSCTRQHGRCGKDRAKSLKLIPARCREWTRSSRPISISSELSHANSDRPKLDNRIQWWIWPYRNRLSCSKSKNTAIWPTSDHLFHQKWAGMTTMEHSLRKGPESMSWKNTKFKNGAIFWTILNRTWTVKQTRRKCWNKSTSICPKPKSTSSSKAEISYRRASKARIKRTNNQPDWKKSLPTSYHRNWKSLKTLTPDLLPETFSRLTELWINRLDKDIFKMMKIKVMKIKKTHRQNRSSKTTSHKGSKRA